MGSVTRRFRRNILARNMAEKVGIINAGAGILLPLAMYRTLMLRTKQRVATINKSFARIASIEVPKPKRTFVQKAGGFLKKLFRRSHA